MANLNSAAIAAGQRQENEVSFHLGRAVGEHEKVHTYYNIKVTHNGHNAQIDHLVLHPNGIIIIESKSVTGEVKVNAHGEWSRSYKGKWSGMASPIVQAENQLAILRGALANNFKPKAGITEKATRWLIDIKPPAECPCEILVAVSSNAIIHRDDMPADISEKVFKTEFIGSFVEKVAKPRTGLMKAKNYFIREQVEELREFFESHQSQNEPNKTFKAPVETKQPHKLNEPKAPTKATQRNLEVEDKNHHTETQAEVWVPTCKHCQSSDSLTPKPGRYGYYVVCGACNKNTPLKEDCPQCKKKNTKVRKRKNRYILSCPDCSYTKEFNSKQA